MGNAKDILEMLSPSAVASRIFRFFLLRPGARTHTSEIRDLLGLGGDSLQRDLRHMVDVGALTVETEGGRTFYRANEAARVWRTIRKLASCTENPSLLVEDALVDVAGLDVAFIFGSLARDEHQADSDIDLFVVQAPGAERTKMFRNLAEASLVLGREINTVIYSAQELADRLGDTTHPAWGFVRGVLTGPKRWVYGSPEALTPLATAAGIVRPDARGDSLDDPRGGS